MKYSADVLTNYIEANDQVPYDDLKYIFGEIMYGGHIVDDFDRTLCMAYLEGIMVNEILMDEFEMFPFVEGKGISFRTPPQISFEKYLEHIDTSLASGETPVAYGLHPNAEIG